jgi:hypothetical protein
MSSARRTAFDRFLLKHDIAAHHIEHLNGVRSRLVIFRRDGRKLAVSFSTRRPSKSAMAKLGHALREFAA